MARKKKHEDHGGGGGGGHGGASGRWLVSYSDFITLLMVVFLVLFSFSRLDVAKYASLAQSLRGSLGGASGAGIAPFPTSGGAGIPTPVAPSGEQGAGADLPDWPAYVMVPPAPAPEPKPEVPKGTPTDQSDNAPSSGSASSKPTKPADPMQGVADIFKRFPGASSGLMSVALEERGVVLSLAGSVLFAPGSVELKPEAGSYLSNVAESLRGIELPIMVTGTADPGYQPGGSGLPPYKIASLRTSAVIEYFVTQKGLPSGSFVFFGSADGGGEDGRVSIIVLRQAN